MPIEILRVTGESEVVTDIKGAPKLEWLQKEVGGYIEIVNLNLSTDRPTQMIVDEEGLLKKKKFNAVATSLCQASAVNNGRSQEFVNEIRIVGDAVLLSGDHLCQ